MGAAPDVSASLACASCRGLAPALWAIPARVRRETAERGLAVVTSTVEANLSRCLISSHEFEIALRQGAVDIFNLGFPRSPIPNHNSSSPILPFWYNAFELVVLDGVVLGLHRESLI